MKKFPKLKLLLLIPLLLLVFVTGCEDKVLNVEEALSSQNGKTVTLSGTIYYIDDDGYYISSDSSYIFVTKMAEDNNTYQVGNTVTVEGYYSFFESFAKITNTKSIEITGTSNPLEPTSSTIKDLSLKEKNEKSVYSSYVTLVGEINVLSSSYSTISDPAGNILYFKGLEGSTFDSKVASANFIVKEYDSSLGFVLELASTPVETQYHISDLKQLIDAELDEISPRVLYDKFNALKSSIDGVTYTLSTDDSSVKLSSFKQVTSKKDITITVTAKYNDETYEYTNKCTLMTSDIITVNKLSNNLPSVNQSTVKIRGVVIAKLANSSLSVYTLILKDSTTSATIPVVFRSVSGVSGNIAPGNGKFQKISVGNTITVTAKYNTEGDYENCLDTITSLEIDEDENVEVKYDFDNAYVLNSRESYSEFALNYKEYYGKLLKFENPYLSFSGTEGTNYSNVVPLYTIDERAKYDSVEYDKYTLVDQTTEEFDSSVTYYTEKDGVYTKADITSFAKSVSYYTYERVAKTISFSIKSNDASYGDSSWRTSIDIPAKNYNYKCFDRDIYCYVVPSTGSYLQVVIASPEFIKIYNDETEEIKLSAMIQDEITNNIYEGTTYTLPRYINQTVYSKTYEITYEESCDSIESIVLNSAQTKYNVTFNFSETPKNVTLKAKYMLGSKEVEVLLTINVSNSTYIDIKDIKSYDDSSTIKSKGIVVAYASETNKSSETSIREYKGFVVKDLETNDCVVVDGIEYVLSSQLFPETSKTLKYFSVDSHSIKIGTIIEFTGVYVKEDNRITLRNNGKLSYVSDLESSTLFDLSTVTTVHNQQELSEALYSFDSDLNTYFNYAKIIKLVGTEENPILFTPTSSKEDSRNNMNYRVHYNLEATNSTQTMVNGYSIAIKQGNQWANTGVERWYDTLNLPEIGTSGAMYPGCLGFSGEMYIVVVYNSSSSDGINSFYNSCAIVEWQSWNLEEVYVNSSIERDTQN